MEDVVLTLSVYSSQTGLEESTKDALYGCLQSVISKLIDKEIDTLCGDWNRHIGREAMDVTGMVNVMQVEIEYLFLLLQMTLPLGIHSLTKEIVTLSLMSLVIKNETDFILLRNRNLKMAKNIKVIPSEECVPQHKFLTCELPLKTPKSHPKPFSRKLCYWELKEQTIQKEFEWVFSSKVNAFNTSAASMEEIWNLLKTALLDTTTETCGKTKKHHHKRVIWWWNNEVNLVIVEKRQCWKA